jgi:hypothetical protein
MIDTDAKTIARIAAAIDRLHALSRQDYDGLPPCYTHDTPEFDRDLRLVCEIARRALAVVATL